MHITAQAPSVCTSLRERRFRRSLHKNSETVGQSFNSVTAGSITTTNLSLLTRQRTQLATLSQPGRMHRCNPLSPPGPRVAHPRPCQSRFRTTNTLLNIASFNNYVWSTTAEVALRPSADNPLGNLSIHRPGDTAMLWEALEVQEATLLHGQPRQVVSEECLVREVLWLLSGLRETMAFEIQSNHTVHVRQNFQVTHLTKGALDNLLASCARFAENLIHLRAFVPSAMAVDVCLPTTAAFSQAISSFLNELDGKMCSCIDDTCTLMQLQASFESEAQQAAALANVLRQSDLLSLSGPMATNKLLSSLYEAVAGNMTRLVRPNGNDPVSRLLRKVFVASLVPTLDGIRQWMFQGELPGNDEFFVVAGQSDPINGGRLSFGGRSPMHWSSGFELRIDDHLDDGDRPLGKTAHGYFYSQELIPEFLQPFVEEILVAGKSMQLLKDLDPERRVVGGSRPRHLSDGREGLDLFVRSLSSAGDAKTTNGQSGLLQACFEVVFPSTDTLLSDKRLASEDAGDADDMDDALPLNGNGVLSQQIHDALRAIVQPAFKAANGQLLDLLRSRYNMDGHLRVLRRFFFLEDGHTMHSTCRSIFHKVLQRQAWRHEAELNADLFDHVPVHERDFLSERLAFTVAKANSEQAAGPSPLAGLALTYSAEWPIDMVVTPSVIADYNLVFGFLVELKYAKWVLDEAMIRDQRHFAPGLDAHKIVLLRARILYFVRVLYEHVMTRILHGLGYEFDRQLREAKTFDDVLQKHKEYIAVVKDRCLLNEKASLVKAAVSRMLGVATRFRTMWDATLSADRRSLHVSMHRPITYVPGGLGIAVVVDCHKPACFATPFLFISISTATLNT
eukprot:m.395581 g.395581  ORF g.395581 m.395581 type:complete len:847 (+) comp20101_c0_seq28:511-3051(+)